MRPFPDTAAASGEERPVETAAASPESASQPRRGVRQHEAQHGRPADDDDDDDDDAVETLWCTPWGVSIVMGVPQNGGFYNTKSDYNGWFRATPMYGNPQMNLLWPAGHYTSSTGLFNMAYPTKKWDSFIQKKGSQMTSNDHRWPSICQ